MPNRGHEQAAARRARFAVGKPSVPPRESPAHHGPVHLRRAAQHRRRGRHLAGRREPADRATRRCPRRAARARDVEAQPLAAASRSPARRCPKRKPAPATTTSAPIAPSTRSANSSGGHAASSRVNSTTSTSSTPSSSISSSRRSSVASISTRLPSTSRGCGSKVTTVGAGPASSAAADHPLVPEVNAVEGADRDRARPALQLPTARATLTAGPAPRRPGRSCSSSASSTPNGPTSVRRSVRSSPPSASAIART